MFFKKSEDSQQENLLDELRQTVAQAKMPAPVEKIAQQELDTLSKIGPASAEYTIGLTYIDYLVTMPWNKKTEDNLDIDRAERILNDDHYGLCFRMGGGTCTDTHESGNPTVAKFSGFCQCRIHYR